VGDAGDGGDELVLRGVAEEGARRSGGRVEGEDGREEQRGREDGAQGGSPGSWGGAGDPRRWGRRRAVYVTISTFSAASTSAMGVMMVDWSEPAKSNPTTRSSLSRTAEPESPGWLIGEAIHCPSKRALGP